MRSVIIECRVLSETVVYFRICHFLQLNRSSATEKAHCYMNLDLQGRLLMSYMRIRTTQTVSLLNASRGKYLEIAREVRFMDLNCYQRAANCQVSDGYKTENSGSAFVQEMLVSAATTMRLDLIFSKLLIRSDYIGLPATAGLHAHCWKQMNCSKLAQFLE